MAFLSDHPASGVGAIQDSAQAAIPRRATLVVMTGAALVAGFVAGHLAARPDTMEPTLVLLLRFMAVLKLGLACGALGLAVWRLGYPASGRLVQGYGIATGLMAIGPGLIWFLGTVALGAVLFHAGLLAFLVLAFRDDGSRSFIGRGGRGLGGHGPTKRFVDRAFGKKPS